MEHASIASFAKFSLDLLALAAPPDLVEAAHRAAIDEVHHARIAWAISSALSATPVGPGPLDVPLASSSATAERCVAETFFDGCVGETAAAARARNAARETSDPALRAALDIIARDEACHADLAWGFVSWAVHAALPGARTALERAVAQARQQLLVAREPVPTSPQYFPGFGLLRPEQVRTLERQTFEGLVLPGVHLLLDATG